MAEPRDPREVVLRQLVLAQQLTRTMVRDSDGVLRALFDEIAAEVTRIDPTAVAPRYRRDRLDRLIRRVAELIGESFDEWAKTTRASLAALGKQQGDASVALLRVTLGEEGAGLAIGGGPSVNMVKAIIDRNPFAIGDADGGLLADFAAGLEADTLKRVRVQLQLGMLREESIDDMVRRLRGVRDGKGGYRGGVLAIKRRHAESVVRTASRYITTKAAEDTYTANGDITSTYQYVATLDGRTTDRCKSLDGKHFRYDDPKAPRPPQHWACRSHITPDVDWESLGITPPDGGTRAARNVEGKTIQVPAKWTYADWLRSQPASKQDEILGRERAVMFRAGDVTLDDLVDSHGKSRPLAELRRRAA